MRWFKRFCCQMGWHSWFVGFEGKHYVGKYGCSVHARCKWCKYEGLIDSQGNLF